MERTVGLEPTTNSLENCYSAVELRSHNVRARRIRISALTINILAYSQIFFEGVIIHPHSRDIVHDIVQVSTYVAEEILIYCNR